MPTVLEVLRTQLIGDEAADAIEQLLAVLSASVLLIPRTPVPSVPVRPSLPTASAEGANPIIEALRTPSPGIEPLLLGEGWSPLAARAIAKLAVRHGRRREDESRRERAVIDAIRRLANAKQKRVVLGCARLLLQMASKSTIIASIFGQLDDGGLMHSLARSVEVDDVSLPQIREIASSLLPHLSLRRGPKVSGASAAYEFLREYERELRLRGSRHPTYRYRSAEYVSPLTAAIRLEFKRPDFDPRPAQRRAKRKRLISHKLIALPAGPKYDN